MTAPSTAQRDAVAVVCHDTGAALALASFVASKHAAGFRLTTVCSGPARQVFRGQGIVPDHEVDGALSENDAAGLVRAISPRALVFGTSFDAWTDRRMCRAAQARGVFTLGLVDWWSNFRRRFSSPGTIDLAYLPDAVAVPDEDARDGCLSDGIPSPLVAATGNPYWDRLYDGRADFSFSVRPSVRRLLGVGEGIVLGLIISSNLWNLGMGLGYDERDFFAAVRPLPVRTRAGRDILWVVKPHPKESPAELARLMAATGTPLRLLEGVTAIDAAAAADLVLGMCSSVLLEAALLGRAVLSLQPGMDGAKMRYLRIFDRLGIPTIVTVRDARQAVVELADGGAQPADLSRLPFPVGGERASASMEKILRDGIAARS